MLRSVSSISGGTVSFAVKPICNYKGDVLRVAWCVTILPHLLKTEVVVMVAIGTGNLFEETHIKSYFCNSTCTAASLSSTLSHTHSLHFMDWTGQLVVCLGRKQVYSLYHQLDTDWSTVFLHLTVLAGKHQTDINCWTYLRCTLWFRCLEQMTTLAGKVIFYTVFLCEMLASLTVSKNLSFSWGN